MKFRLPVIGEIRFNPVVMFTSIALIWSFVIWCILLGEDVPFNRWKSWIVQHLTWLYVGTLVRSQGPIKSCFSSKYCTESTVLFFTGSQRLICANIVLQQVLQPQAWQGHWSARVQWPVLVHDALCLWSWDWTLLLGSCWTNFSLHWQEQIHGWPNNPRQHFGSDSHEHNIVPLGWVVTTSIYFPVWPKLSLFILAKLYFLERLILIETLLLIREEIKWPYELLFLMNFQGFTAGYCTA